MAKMSDILRRLKQYFTKEAQDRASGDSTLNTKIETETIRATTAESGKADKVINGVENNIVLLDSNGNIKDSGKSLADTGKIDSVSIDGTTITPDANKNVDLPAYPTRVSLLINNVDNTSDANKPVSTAQQTAIDSTGHKIDLEIDSTNFKVVAKLYDANNTLISTSSEIDLPLESVVVSGYYSSLTKEVVLTLQSGSVIRFSVADLISGLQSQIDAQHKLSSDLVDDTGNAHKFVSGEEKAQITTNQNDITNIKDGTNIDSFSDVETELDKKANSSDVNTALSGKVDKETGKGLSTNDYTTSEKEKLRDIESGAEVNDVNSVNGKTGVVVLDSDDIDDTNNSHKFVTANEKAQITTNANDIVGIKDGTNIDSFADVEEALENVGGSVEVVDGYEKKWIPKIWNGIEDATLFAGGTIWTDGENIYMSYSANQYVLDKSTSTWTTKVWNGLTSFIGGYIWTDGENIYYSQGSLQYVLDKSTSTWNVKTWNGLTSFGGGYIWTDGENIYYSRNSLQYVLDKSTSTWTTKVWNGLTSFDGGYIWTDGENIYYSYARTAEQYVLDKSTSTWNVKTWNGINNFTGNATWTDGENIYISSTSSSGGHVVGNFILDRETSTWVSITWENFNTLTNGDYIWNNGNNVYYIEINKSKSIDKQYEFVIPTHQATILEKVAETGSYNDLKDKPEIYNKDEIDALTSLKILDLPKTPYGTITQEQFDNILCYVIKRGELFYNPYNVRSQTVIGHVPQTEYIEGKSYYAHLIGTSQYAPISDETEFNSFVQNEKYEVVFAMQEGIVYTFTHIDMDSYAYNITITSLNEWQYDIYKLWNNS